VSISAGSAEMYHAVVLCASRRGSTHAFDGYPLLARSEQLPFVVLDHSLLLRRLKLAAEIVRSRAGKLADELVDRRRISNVQPRRNQHRRPPTALAQLELAQHAIVVGPKPAARAALAYAGRRSEQDGRRPRATRCAAGCRG
jgi:hypothetical protein